jgi:hypothetical protein
MCPDKKEKRFINKVNKKYNYKYDYSLVNYIDNETIKVKIICPIHGVFEQLPRDHIHSKYGCLRCGIETAAKERSSTLKGFIEKANRVHNYKYDYSLVNYIKNCIKVKIICPIHEIFEQTPHDHLANHECPYCGIINTTVKNSCTLENFITTALSKFINNYLK